MAGPDDLIVVCSHHAMTHPRPSILGNVTLACLRHARCPVVVVLATKHEE